MSEVELLLVNSSESCTMYTIQFLSDVSTGNVEITEKEILIDKTFEV